MSNRINLVKVFEYISNVAGLIVSVKTANYMEIRTNDGIVDVQPNGLCRYYANDDMFNFTVTADQIIANMESHVVEFIKLNLIRPDSI